MTLYEHEEIAREEGRKEGREIATANFVPVLIKMGLSVEEACKEAGITIERYQELSADIL